MGEDEAVDVLATQFGVLLMPGSPFGAPRHLRLSYGSLKPQDVADAVLNLKCGILHLIEVSKIRIANKVTK